MTSFFKLDNNDNPFDIFANWMKEASIAEPNNPNAMCLSTVSATGKPSSRMVLLKEHDESGFVFYTNSHSKKGEQLNENPNVALNFYWKTLQRQVRIEGAVTIVPRAMTEAYFHSRPRESQIASYASDQSQPLENKQIYLDRITQIKKDYEGVEHIPCPDHWNGYRVIPTLIEFWQEAEFRTHDRFVFHCTENRQWTIERQYP